MSAAPDSSRSLPEDRIRIPDILLADYDLRRFVETQMYRAGLITDADMEIREFQRSEYVSAMDNLIAGYSPATGKYYVSPPEPDVNSQ